MIHPDLDPKMARLGTVAAYSNVGFALLADALAAAGGKDYWALLYDRITGRLGMPDTGVALTREQCDQLMTGSGLGGPGPCADTTAPEGKGGLYSTGNDMAVWPRHDLADGATSGCSSPSTASTSGCLRPDRGGERAAREPRAALSECVRRPLAGDPAQ
ncbi:MAG: serine hydrolase [Alphaproteobacteria bacterium]|nr:serine hydrolase [Alphaproteobacteria bacterium]